MNLPEIMEPDGFIVQSAGDLGKVLREIGLFAFGPSCYEFAFVSASMDVFFQIFFCSEFSQAIHGSCLPSVVLEEADG